MESCNINLKNVIYIVIYGITQFFKFMLISYLF